MGKGGGVMFGPTVSRRIGPTGWKHWATRKEEVGFGNRDEIAPFSINIWDC